MSEPIAASALMAKYSALIAGFLGSVVTLSFVRDLPRVAMLTSVGTGAVTAHYMTPLVWLSWPALSGQFGISFLLGILAMNIIPGVMRLGEEFSKAPLRFIKTLIKR